jgi:hypothetical protein
MGNGTCEEWAQSNAWGLTDIPEIRESAILDLFGDRLFLTWGFLAAGLSDRFICFP